MFKSKNSGRREDNYWRDDYVKAYKVWPSDEDRGQWVADPGKKRSGFSFLGMFKSKNSSRRDNQDYYLREDCMKAYKVWPSDEDRGQWVADPGIDNKAALFISNRTAKWSNVPES
ncbi:hypothetical protein T459_33607 [Capsicum annuum]|uniref:Uncharacterized protein n=1 Tax=Capsicum annuum TaxID=4072 RepID=A0A2G2XYF8_CAPAN|nr:hypothetical protein T459_33607 [Capsicum annuum]